MLSMEIIAKKLGEMRVVPVVKIDKAQDAKPLAQALCEGGLPCAEVTFRTQAAADAIREMTKAYPDMLIGAGTVLTAEQVDAAFYAGASFIVSPGLNPKTVKYCLDKNIPIIPGVATASEIEQGIDLGLNILKIFPAQQIGGVGLIKALSAPYSSIKFMPTGGVNEANINDYLALGAVLCCGGSWMVTADMINGGKFDEITKMTRSAIELTRR